MAIHGTIKARQWIERQRCTTAVEKGNARVAGTDAAPPEWQQVGDMLGKQQSGVPVACISGGVVNHRQPAQVAVASGHFIALTHWLQAGTEQHVGGLNRTLAQLLLVGAA
ncbi:hypothetical protein D3C77_365370 [compost metagenome]